MAQPELTVSERLLIALRLKKQPSVSIKPSAKPVAPDSDAVPSAPKTGVRKILDLAVEADTVPNESDEIIRYHRLNRLIHWQGTLTALAIALLLLILPFLRPVNLYVARTPDGKAQELIPLDMPNLTTPTVIAWASVSVTEILTFGFGDIDQQIIGQRQRFTAEGWSSFLRAIIRQGWWQKVKKQQVIVTTVPSDLPLISSQGLNKEGIYQWNVEIPIIQTFVTNNNVSDRKKDIVYLEIVRVPPKESVQGLAIQSWNKVTVQ